MTTKQLKDMLTALEVRRRALGMSTQVLAQRSGVSRATVCRILSGDSTSASLRNVMAVAEAMGMSTRFDPVVESGEYLRKRAEEKARYAVGMVQGTMGLEAQGINPSEKEELIVEVRDRLLSGSKRKLWR